MMKSVKEKKLSGKEYEILSVIGLMTPIRQLEKHYVKDKQVQLAQGIYYLLKEEEVVYIGKSKNVFRRIEKHIQEKEKDFDSYSYQLIEYCSYEELGIYESIYISMKQPRYNKNSKNKNLLGN